MSTERIWTLTKYSDLNANGRVYTNNISLHVQLSRRLMVVCHNMQPLVEVPLWVPNLLIKSKDNSVLVHLQQQREDRKFRFRLLNLVQLKEVTIVLSQFVKITDMNQTSQDIFSQLSSASQISQDSSFSQSTFSQSNSSQSQNSFSDLNASPYYNEPHSPFYSTNLLTESGAQAEPYDHPFRMCRTTPNGGSAFHQSPPYTASLRQSSASPLMENFRHSAISNPYTSPFIRSTTSEAPSLDNINNNVIDSSTSRKNFSYLKDKNIQTDNDTFCKYGSDDFVKIIMALCEDSSFENLVSQIKEAVNKIKESRSVDNEIPTVESSKFTKSTQDDVAQQASRKSKLAQEKHKEDFTVAFGRVDRLLNDF